MLDRAVIATMPIFVVGFEKVHILMVAVATAMMVVVMMR